LKLKSPFSLLLERFDKMGGLLFKGSPSYKLVGLNNYLEPIEILSKEDIRDFFQSIILDYLKN
jgi:hypothetical protein